MKGNRLFRESVASALMKYIFIGKQKIVLNSKLKKKNQKKALLVLLDSH
jgi:hypothetical protein